MTDPQGRPLQNVTIDVRWSNGHVPATSTDSQGNYTVSRLGSGTYRLGFSAPGYLRQWFNGRDTEETADPVTVVNGQQTASVDVVLRPAPTHGTISGRVTDTEGLRWRTSA